MGPVDWRAETDGLNGTGMRMMMTLLLPTRRLTMTMLMMMMMMMIKARREAETMTEVPDGRAVWRERERWRWRWRARVQAAVGGWCAGARLDEPPSQAAGLSRRGLRMWKEKHWSPIAWQRESEGARVTERGKHAHCMCTRHGHDNQASTAGAAVHRPAERVLRTLPTTTTAA
jgi:hypothetical protein